MPYTKEDKSEYVYSLVKYMPQNLYGGSSSNMQYKRISFGQPRGVFFCPIQVAPQSNPQWGGGNTIGTTYYSNYMPTSTNTLSSDANARSGGWCNSQYRGIYGYHRMFSTIMKGSAILSDQNYTGVMSDSNTYRAQSPVGGYVTKSLTNSIYRIPWKHSKMSSPFLYVDGSVKTMTYKTVNNFDGNWIPSH